MMEPSARGKPWKQLIDAHEKSGLNRRKKTLQRRVLVVTTVIYTKTSNVSHNIPAIMKFYVALGFGKQPVFYYFSLC